MDSEQSTAICKQLRAIVKNVRHVDTGASPSIIAHSNMPAPTSSLERINQLKAEIASLEQAAIQELMERRNHLSRELATVDAELAKLTGKPVEGKKPRAATSESTGRNIPLQELKEELAAAPNKTLNIRKANLQLRNIKVLAEANPTLLKLGGKGAWPTVTLLK